MIDPKSGKKSETVEIRLPYPTKSALMHKAKAEGSSVSEVVRSQIEAYLDRKAEEESPPLPVNAWLRRNARRMSLALVAVAGLAIAGLAISPATARPDLTSAFRALDTDNDGVIELSEFTDPHRAMTTDIGNAGAAPADGALVDIQTKGPKGYIRYMLDGGAGAGIIPLVIVVAANSNVTEADIGRLVGEAFARLDSNGDGQLSGREFGLR